MDKICSKCQSNKDISLFKKDPRLKSGYGSRCLECCQTYLALYNIKNNDRLRRDKVKHYFQNREKNLSRHKKYRLDNLEKCKAKDAAYYAKNKKRIIKRNSIWHKKRSNSFPQYRITRNLRKRIWCALNSQSAIKHDKTIILAGCSVKQLICHLESQFEPKMNWSNYGEWHVDHIKPCSAFDLDNPQEQQKCFHFTNLQPLWAKDNLTKSDNLNWQKRV